MRIVKEVWRFRALVWSLVCRHLNARYRGSVLGFIWSFLNPLCLIAVYSLVFKYYIRFESEHYTVFLFAGLLPWIWFSTGLLEATSAISSGGNLITKALFPPHILPVVSVITNLMNFLFAIPLLLAFMFYEGIPFGPGLWLLPVVILFEFVFLAGLSFCLSALNVHFRDIQHILGNFLTLWFFLCPISYPVSVVPEKFRFTLTWNPMALFTQMYHDMFLHGRFPDVSLFAVTGIIAVVTFIVGSTVFNVYREEFAELV